MKKEKKNKIQYCFSELLQNQLVKISENFLTVVEAPSGFGKTTAVREYLANGLLKDVHEKWYTCLGESSEKAWRGICKLFSGIDSVFADDLMELGVPTKETLADMVALLREFHCWDTTYIVIDNYQLFKTSIPKELIAALSNCPIKNLHLVLITQPLKDDFEGTYSNHSYHKITSQDFFFDNACIARYCHLARIKILPEHIEHIQVVCEGWIAAIRLQLKNYEDTGLLMNASSISSLVENAVWNKLSAQEKEFMMAVSLLGSLTAQQAVIMGGGELPENVMPLLSLDFFMRHVSDKNVYSMHSILRDYLLERLAMQPQEFIDVMHRRAASASLAGADYFQAAQFFMKVADYDAILSLPFTSQYFYNNKERNLVDFFQRFIDECPQKILQKYPICLVLIGHLFFRHGEHTYFLKMTHIISKILDEPQGLTKEQLAQAQAEFAILMALTEYNDIIKMSVYHKKAYAYLKTISDSPRSIIFQDAIPWGLGAPSVIAVHWNACGKMQEEIEAMEDCLPIYLELTNGHGAGADHAFKAEANLVCGNDVTAETLCYKAIYQAREADQLGICLCAERTLAEVALLRGDATLYYAMRDDIAKTATNSGRGSVRRMGELCLAVLDLALGRTQHLPNWLYSTEGIRKTFYAHALPYGFLVHARLLLHKHCYAEFYALAEHGLNLTRNNSLSPNMNYAFMQVHYILYFAVAKEQDGLHEEAVVYLKEALSLALPDRVYFPFAQFAATLLPLLEELKVLPEYNSIDELIFLCKRYRAGVDAVGNQQNKHASILTPREKEVAMLARERLSAVEIATQLSISVHTVNTILKSVYRKLDISSKSALKDKIF